MQIHVKHDLQEVRAAIGRIAREQIPFGSSLAVNAVARQARDKMPAVFERVMDRPKPFTTRSSIFTTVATKAKPEAIVGIKDKQAEYLAALLSGGQRRLKVVEQRFMGRFFVPTKAAPTDSYGNVSKATLLSILRAATSGGDWRGKRIVVLQQQSGSLPAGVYAAPRSGAARRSLKAMTLLLLFVTRSPAYRRTIRFDDEVFQVVRAGWNAAFVAAMARAQGVAL